MENKPDKINIGEKFGLFTKHWSPKIIAAVNDCYVKLVKFQGEFIRHKHENEDELFFVVRGRLTIRFRDRDVSLEPGEMIVIPKGVEHMPVAPEQVWAMLIEPKTQQQTT